MLYFNFSAKDMRFVRPGPDNGLGIVSGASIRFPPSLAYL